MFKTVALGTQSGGPGMDSGALTGAQDWALFLTVEAMSGKCPSIETELVCMMKFLVKALRPEELKGDVSVSYKRAITSR